MNRSLVVGLCLILAGSAALAVKWTGGTGTRVVTLTSASGGNSSAKVDTVWCNNDVSVGTLMPYNKLYLKVTVGKMYQADTTLGAHRYGLRDTIMLAIKKRVGSRVVLLDSTKFVDSLKANSVSTTLMLSAALDTLWADDVFAWVRIADSNADTAGIPIRINVTTELYAKE